MNATQPPLEMPTSAASGEPVSEETHIGPYRVVRRLEVSATSESVLAVSQGPLGFERTVVIKRLLPHAHADEKVVRGFGREASAYARLTHPAIVRLYDFFAINDQPAMVLEHIEAISLARLLERLRERNERLPLPAAMFVGARIFAALAAAHSARDPRTREFSPVIHRDVSPGNVLVTVEGDVRLTNFGFAKLIGTGTDSSLGHSLTASGYLAPEQLLCSPVTVRTDVYAAALVVRELLTGEPAFPRGDRPYVDYLQAIAAPKLAPITSTCAFLPQAIADALTRALEPDAEKRDMTAASMQRLLNAHREGGRAKLAEVVARLDPAASGDGERAEMPSDPTISETRVMRRIELEQAKAIEEAADETDLEEASLPPKALDPAAMLTEEQVDAWHRRSSHTQPSLYRSRARGKWLLATIVGLGVVVSGAVVVGGRPLALRARTPAPAASATEAHAAPPATAAPPPMSNTQTTAAATTPIEAPTTGELRALPSSPAHRVYVDGKMMGESGSVMTVPCGQHVVRIGSGGKARTIAVPCGGSADLATR